MDSMLLEEEILKNLNRIVNPLKNHTEYQSNIKGFLCELMMHLLTSQFQARLSNNEDVGVKISLDVKDKSLEETIKREYELFNNVVLDLLNYTNELSYMMIKDYDSKSTVKVLRTMLTNEKILSTILLYFNGDVLGYKKASRTAIQQVTGFNFN